MMTDQFRIHGLSALAALLASASVVHAQTIWTGAGGDGDWNTAANWDSGVPAEGIPAVVTNGTTVNYSAPMTAPGFAGLTLSKILNVNAGGFTIDAFGGTPLTTSSGGFLNIGPNGVVLITNSAGSSIGTDSSISVSGTLIVTNNFGPFSAGLNGNNNGMGFTNAGGNVVFSEPFQLRGRHSRFVMTGGTLDLQGGGGMYESSNDNERGWLINGGVANLGAFSVNRTLHAAGNGLTISNGIVNATSLQIGVGASRASATVAGGVLTNTGLFAINDRANAATSGERRVFFYVRGGSVYSTTPEGIIVGNQSNAGSAGANIMGGFFEVTAGSVWAEGITLVRDSSLVNVHGTFTLGGSGQVYLGQVGLVGNVGESGTSYTINLNGGTLGALADYTIAGNATIGGNLTIKAADPNDVARNITHEGVFSGAGTLRKTGAGTLTLNGANTFTGPTTISEGTLVLGGSLASSTISLAAGTTFDVSAAPGYTVNANQALSGFGTVVGDVALASGGIINPGSNTITGTLTINGSLTETGGAINQFNLSADPSGPNNDLIVVQGDLNVSGSDNILDIIGSGPAGSIHPLFRYTGSFNGDLSSFTINGAAGILTNITTSSPKAIAFIPTQTIRPATDVVWVGNPVNNDWDVVNTTNWLNNGVLDYFVANDNVFFNSVGLANPNVNIPAVVAPASITVDAAGDYVLSGSGTISGSTGILKTNSGRLTIDMDNLFSGGVTIKGGTVSVSSLADEGSSSPLGQSGTILVDGGTLEYSGDNQTWTRSFTVGESGGAVAVSNEFSALTLNGVVTGNGSLIKTGPGNLILNTGNNYAGGTVVSNGVLTINNVSGASSGTITLGGGVLAVGAVKPANTVHAAVPGIIRGGNAGGATGIRNVTGNADVTIAVTTGVFDLTGNMYDYSGTITFSNAGGGIVRMNGSTGSSQATWDLGSGPMELNIRTGSTSNNFGGLMGGFDTVLSGRSSSDNNGPTTHYIGANGLSTTFDGSIRNGAGVNQILSIVKVGSGTLTLSGISTYTGVTDVREGVLRLIDSGSIDNSSNIVVAAGAAIDVSQRYDATLQASIGGLQDLTGSGTILGSVVHYGNGTINPGLPIGTLTITNGLTAYGPITLELNRAVGAKNDRLVANTFELYGQVTVTNVGPDLANGDTFQLFNKGVTLSAPAILPETDSTGTATYVWDDQIAVNGTITLVSGGLPPVDNTPTNIVASVAGGVMTLTWPESHIGWTLQVQTNSLSVGLSNNWVDVVESVATNRVDLPIDNANGAVFFRLILPNP